MCPICYINGLLFLIFGASGATMADNPWIIAISILLTIAGFWWMWKAYKRNKGTGGWKKNLKTSVLFLLVFAAGYGTATWQTHEYFEHKYNAEHKHN